MERGKGDILSLGIAFDHVGKGASRSIKPIRDLMNEASEGKGRSRHHIFQTNTWNKLRKEVNSGRYSLE